MQYVIWADDENGDSVRHVAEVPKGDADYLRRVIETLKPLSDDEYLDGAAAILQTAARFSYVLDGPILYWCVEWEPGFVVVRFAPNEPLAWTAIRSPVPDFAGREPVPDDVEAFDEEADNPQYNLVFHPWDAQFDEDDLEFGGFVPAGDDVEERFEAALVHVNTLGDVLEERMGDDDEAHEAWCERCIANLEQWCGDGIRL